VNLPFFAAAKKLRENHLSRKICRLRKISTFAGYFPVDGIRMPAQLLGYLGFQVVYLLRAPFMYSSLLRRFRLCIANAGLFAGRQCGNRDVRRKNGDLRRIRPRFEALERREVLSSIHGAMFNDGNANAVADNGEAGLAGWTVYLDDNRNAILDPGEMSTSTDGSGQYFFDTTGKPSAIGCSATCDFVSFALPVGSGGRWLNTTAEAFGINRTNEPDATRDFGAYFQPDVGIAPVGGEAVVNVTTAGQQGEGADGPANVAVAADAAGNYAIAWRTITGSGTDTISARVFNADGSARTGEIPVASFAPISGTFAMPAIAMAGNGRFTVAWHSFATVRGATVQSVQARSFAADGSAAGGIITINAPNGATASGAWLNGIAADSTGNFAIAYGYYKNGTQIYVQRYTSAGAANGKAIFVASPSSMTSRTSIAMDGSGKFVVVWDDGATFGQRFTASGAKTGSQIVVASSNSRYSNVAMNSNGQFVVTWFDDGTGLQSAKRYNADGTPAGGPVSFSTALKGSSGNQVGVSIDLAGNAAFTWTDRRSFSSYSSGIAEVRVRRYTAGGLEPETIANTTTEGAQYQSGVAATGDGTLVVAWEGYGPTDDTGIYAQRFGPPATATASATDSALLLLLMTDPSATTKRK
jgi:hypothetical protein